MAVTNTQVELSRKQLVRIAKELGISQPTKKKTEVLIEKIREIDPEYLGETRELIQDEAEAVSAEAIAELCGPDPAPEGWDKIEGGVEGTSEEPEAVLEVTVPEAAPEEPTALEQPATVDPAAEPAPETVAEVAAEMPAEAPAPEPAPAGGKKKKAAKEPFTAEKLAKITAEHAAEQAEGAPANGEEFYTKDSRRHRVLRSIRSAEGLRIESIRIADGRRFWFGPSMVKTFRFVESVATA